MILTTGVAGGPLLPRQEIRVFAKNRELMELYLQGLQRFQAVDQANPLSWFQIAGIHGRPYIPYDGAGTASASRSFPGYCTHSSILFPPWHRPYLALFEQALAKHINDIAKEYKGADSAKYLAAAQQFRAPYWDWAANADLPDFISIQATVTVNTPTGVKTFPNPLFAYKFNPLYQTFGDGLPDERVWEAFTSTIRYPTALNGSGKSNTTRLEATLQNNRLTIRDRTYNLLTGAADYASFSNDGGDSVSNVGSFDSLEAIHGMLHGLLGSNGHMGVVDFAAFDPVFWLHHANVDRLFAIWQALNPDKYVIPRTNPRGNWATAPGTVENVNTPLAPFWRTQGVYWTSAGARDTRTFNYTYPELEKWAQLSAADKSRRLRTDINAMYGRTAPIAAAAPELFAAAQSRVSVPFDVIKGQIGALAAQPAAAAVSAPIAVSRIAAVPAPAAAEAKAAPVAVQAQAAEPVAKNPPVAQQVLQAPVASIAAAVKKVEAVVAPGAAKATGLDQKHYYEWAANILVEKYAAKSTFYVHIFLGDFSDDPSLWGQDKNLVGTHVVFANNLAVTGCQRCKEAAAQHRVVKGSIPLTGALGDHFGAQKIKTLTPAEATPYLTKNLHWRIQRSDGSVINRTEMPGLKVTVAHFRTKIPESPDEFPVREAGEKDLDVTVGRPGGAEADD